MATTITNVTELQAMKDTLDGDFILGNNIDASATTGWNAGAGFIPVGASGAEFTGSFDGKSYTITSLYIDRSATAYVGLFGLADPTSIKDVTLASADITGDYFVGILAGYLDDDNSGTVENCHVAGQVAASDWAGGLTGRANYNNTITDSSADVTMSVVSTGDDCGYTGGFIGANYAQVEDCFAAGTLSVTGFAAKDIDYIGGFVGHLWNLREIRRSYSTVDITINGVNIADVFAVGGFVGHTIDGTVYDCYSRGDVTIDVTATGSKFWIGGFVGAGEAVYRAYSTGAITAPGSTYVGGFIGKSNAPPPIEDCYWDTETSGTDTSDDGTGRTTAQMKLQLTFTNWDFTNIWAIDASHNDGYPYFGVGGVIGRCYVIPDVLDLKGRVPKGAKVTALRADTHELIKTGEIDSGGNATICGLPLDTDVVFHVTWGGSSAAGTQQERWFYSDVAGVTEGGTGSSNAGTARTNLGLAIGTDVQAWDDDLDDIAALTPTDDYAIMGDGTDWASRRILGADVEVSELSTATYDDVQDYINFFGDRTLLSGGGISAHGDADGSVAIAACTAWSKESDSDTAVGKFFDYAGKAKQTLTDLNVNLIYLDYNAGTPQIVVATTPVTYGFQQDHILLGVVFRQGTAVHIFQSSNVGIQGINRTFMHAVEHLGAHRSGGLVTTDGGTLALSITAGIIYAGLNRQATTVDGSTWSYWYTSDSGSTWTEDTGISALVQSYNDITSGKVSLGSNKYGVHWVYVDYEGSHLHIVYGQGNYTAPQAEEAGVPSVLPPIVVGYGVLIAKIINQEGTNTLTITYPWTTVFTSSLATDHNSLANLTTGDVHTQYFLVAGETTDAKLYSGADLIVYSDAGSTEVARIDGATGAMTTSSTVDGRDIDADGTKLDNVISNTQAITHAITDNKTVTVDGTPATSSLARWTANGLEGQVQTGTTFPTSPAPTKGQVFCHAPTGRTILYEYDGSNWVAVISMGTMTLYVDATDGTDQLTDHGTGVDGDAFATVQYAWDTIPGLFGGNVTININDESYAEDLVLGGKTPTGAYTITFQGATPTVLDNGIAVGAAVRASAFNNTTKTWGTVTRKVDTWTVNQRQDKWLRFTSGNCDDEYFLIDSNTETIATIIGRFHYAGTPAVDDTFNIEEPATGIQSFVLKPHQIGVRFNDIDWTAIPTTAAYTPFPAASECELHRCQLDSAALTSLWAVNGAIAEIDTCLSHNIRYLLRTACYIAFIACKVYRGIYDRTIQSDASCLCSLGATVLDGENDVTSKGVYCYGLGYCIGHAAPKRSNVTLTSNVIRDYNEAVVAAMNGVASVFVPANDSYCTFVSNTTDTTTATGGQID